MGKILEIGQVRVTIHAFEFAMRGFREFIHIDIKGNSLLVTLFGKIAILMTHHTIVIGLLGLRENGTRDNYRNQDDTDPFQRFYQQSAPSGYQKHKPHYFKW
jgi:hypothetical protein